MNLQSNIIIYQTEERLMAINIKTITTTLLLCATVAVGHAQSRNVWYGKQVKQGEYLTLNSELIDVFNTLDSIFPKHYLINEEPNCVGMWVNSRFKNQKEYEDVRETIEQLIIRLRDVPAYRSYTERIDSTGASGFGISLTPKTDNYAQKDYAYLNLNPTSFSFHYTGYIEGMKMPWEKRQDVADAIDKLFAKYIKKKGVKSEKIDFDGEKFVYRYSCFFKQYDSTYRCSGVRYVVPNCTSEDYDIIYRFLRDYAMTNSVTVASNDMSSKYEEITLSVNQDNNSPVIFGAALRGTDLYLIRTVGETGSQAWIPRAWAE